MTMHENDERSAIAARLREARGMAGLSQKSVAEMLGLHRPSVSEMEAGNRRVSADELRQLADLYDVSVDWLLGKSQSAVTTDDPKLQLAARELRKLKPSDLDRLLKLLAAMRSDRSGRGSK
jgi:transcriptional regulator with XRE-family HTH domain